MKREILFKAKRVNNGQWIEGQLAYFFDNKETPYIMPNCYFGTREMGEYDDEENPILSDEIALGGFISVHPETVCQFTGKLDVNKNKIFENDVVQYSENPLNKVVVSWNKRTCGFVLNKPNYQTEFTRMSGLGKLKVISNIHDND
jgi:hypothetical protein